MRNLYKLHFLFLAVVCSPLISVQCIKLFQELSEKFLNIRIFPLAFSPKLTVSGATAAALGTPFHLEVPGSFKSFISSKTLEDKLRFKMAISVSNMDF